MPVYFSIMFIVGAAVAGFAAGYAYVRVALKVSEEERLKLEHKNAALTQQLQQNATAAQLEEKFSLQFENLANRIFEEKNEKFKKDSAESLGHLLNPLRERLHEFQKKVDDSFGNQMKEQFSLRKEIENIVLTNEKMRVQTESLTKALKGDVKAQGTWGEIALERILEDAGLQKPYHYTLQGAGLDLKDGETGRAQRPDVIIHLPDGKNIIVDAKVSLTHYERYISATSEADRTLLLKQYIQSIYAHIDGLTARNYQDNEKLKTLDIVLMFMPVEGAFSLAMQEDPGLQSYAWGKRVALISPSTLFVTMRTVAAAWRTDMQNKNAIEIARQGGNLYDKVAGFIDIMQDLGDKLGAARKVYDKAFENLTTGQGNILRRAESLRELGVKTTKKMPAGLLADGGDDSEIKKVENS